MIAARPVAPVVAAVVVAVAVVADQLGIGQPWRGVAVFCFVACGPGLAGLHLVRIDGRTARAVLAVSASLALAACLSEALAIAHLWSATALLIALAAVCLLACALPRRAA